MPPTVRQTNFRAGELSPLLWGRTDLAIYAKGARRMRNFFPSKEGAAVSRPGTTYVAGAKYIDAPSLGPERDEGQARLIRFDTGDELYQSYILEFGKQYIRFIVNGAQVLDGGGNAYEVATPYSPSDVWALQFAQVGDTLYLTCPEWDPYVLRRNGPLDWSFEKVRFAAYSPYATDPGSDPQQPTTGFCVDASTVGTPDTDHPAREWQWLWTAIVRDLKTGALYETLTEPIVEQVTGDDYDGTVTAITDDSFPVYEDMPVTLRRCETDGLLTTPEGFDTYEVVEFVIYRGRGGLFGFVGTTKTRLFVDVGEAPDYAIQPPQGTEPFGTETEATGQAAPFDTRRLQRPAAVAFFQQRLCFAGTEKFPNDLWTSEAGDFLNWDVRLYKNVSGEALHFGLAARRRETVRSMAVQNRLALLTSASAWTVGGQVGMPLDFDSVDARVEDEVGATTLPPLIVDGVLLFARAKGRGVRALTPQSQDTPAAGFDVSEHAAHLFTGADKNLVDWCYAEDPWGLVWAVRADGSLLSLTFRRDSWGWARHDTDGVVESLCSVPEGQEDAVYLVVVRELADGTKHRYIERMTSRLEYGGAVADATPAIEAPPDGICLDSSLQYFGPPVQVLSGLEHLEGKEVWVLAQGSDPIGPLTVTGGEIDLGDTLAANVSTVVGDRLVCYVGLRFTPQLETLDVPGSEARLRKKTVERIGFEVNQSIGLAVGQDFEHLDEWVQRDVDDDGFNAVSSATTLVDMPVESTWDQSARACLEQTMPLPVTVVGLTRELAFGD